MLLEVDEQTIDAGSAAALQNKLLQLCNGAVYDSTGAVAEVHDCKLEVLRETVEALCGAHALVFYSFRHDVPRIKAALEPLHLRIREYTGPADADDWNAGKIDILLAHPASTAYGLNLQQGGYHVIWFGQNWSLELYQQANARLHRQGQTHPVIVHHLAVEGGADEDVLRALDESDKVQTAVDNIVEVKAMLYDRLIDATELRRGIQAAIDTVDDARLRNLLEYRYIDALTWDKVAEVMSLDRKWVITLHGRALSALNI
ncbi:MAG TPA: DEAD/DEAH box helicase [Clostridia bacterium]|nr:DEAD/DEAH box helicase [Clostridia bacterium]